ncbi:hypothetical protein ES677_11895 [Bizionia gelidisalsuginis]|uniref:Uncharacterized protein n=2 Tax=Bizionia TaxID=283785 RepID=A0A8H2LBH4_9FLAO|nr:MULTISPECIES: hypothetical protein [Bizionia]TYB70689.1 hypothetical protein ES676_13000 [Bizionia saleffrena]TYC10183.1 hypothetical protein ES677_11895 [Bizionia gelidisalsuginis]
MPEQLVTVKEVFINNNCPECFSKEGLHLTFKQKFIDTRFYKSIGKDIFTEMHCTICETPIYPQRWTEDIERVYRYQNKALTPEKPSTQLKKLSWILVGLVIGIIITSIVLTLYLRV